VPRRSWDFFSVSSGLNDVRPPLRGHPAISSRRKPAQGDRIFGKREVLQNYCSAIIFFPTTGPVPMELRTARKPAAAVLVLSLHAAVLVFLLQRERWPIAEPKAAGPVIVFVHIAAPPPAATPRHDNRLPQKRRVQAAVPTIAPFVVQPFTAPAARTANDLTDLHGQLFRCAPESLDKLTPEERDDCARAAGGIARHDPDAIPWPNNKYAPTENTWRWARNVQRKNAPPLLPCASPNGISPIGTALCLANAAVNGFDAEHKPEYFDHPDKVGVPNGGDPPMTPEH
jgi:hypothetical protein